MGRPKRNVPLVCSLASFVLVACTTAEEAAFPADGQDGNFGSSAEVGNGPERPETPFDGSKNGTETDVDCGGAGDTPRCGDGKGCNTGSDCASRVCMNGTCQAPRPDDGVKNGDETDDDCGGAGDTPRCGDGKGCNTGSDCASRVCMNGTCQAPRPDDGVKNGDETDDDCGGANPETPRCAVGKACKAHSDCESDGCAYNGKCALARSCTGHHGGDTCGAGETGTPQAQHESCCAAAPISEAPGAPLLDKYLVTAGRMRQFIERMNGNLRAFGETLDGNPNWNPAWNAMLPASVEEANYLLGPTGHGSSRRGCDLGASRGRTYWMSAEENKALGETGTHPFSKEVLDEKVLNCVEFFMLQALCIWDGGRLATAAEIQAAWQGGENRAYPWGNDFDPNKLVHKWNYAFPQVYDQGNFVYVAAPGRRPAGNGKFGHADLAGLLIEMTSNVSGDQIAWVSTGSWENHPPQPYGNRVGTTVITRAYWATGGRCARPR